MAASTPNRRPKRKPTTATARVSPVAKVISSSQPWGPHCISSRNDLGVMRLLEPSPALRAGEGRVGAERSEVRHRLHARTDLAALGPHPIPPPAAPGEGERAAITSCRGALRLR